MPIHFPSMLIACVAAAAAGCFFGCRATRDPKVTLSNMHRRVRWLTPVALFFSSCIIAIALVHMPRSTIVWMPISVQLAFPVVIWFIALPQVTFLLAMVTVVALRTAHRRKYALVILSLTVPSLLLGNIALQHRPIASELTVQSRRGVILQSSTSSCAAATVANLDRLRGGTLTEGEAAELMGTTRSGTSTAQIYSGLDELGLEPRVRIDFDPQSLLFPAVLIVDHPETGRESHAIAYIATRQDMFEVWDPTHGRALMSEEELEQIWHGVVIECLALSVPRER